MVAKKKGAGGSLTRTQVVTVRLDPKLKFAAELAARKQRRTISSFIEWAIEQAVGNIEVTREVGEQRGDTVLDVSQHTWHPVEADRFAKLALNYPDLLNFEEDTMWNIILDCQHFWKGGFPIDAGVYPKPIDAFHFGNLRDKWHELLEVIEGKRDISWLMSLEAAPKND